ncbi:GabT 4-aminobutyrate aminotransferase and related aminotransferases [Candidatus Nanopelagicaceae bacterium]|jgi:4-aminobutyrate aminotransferase/(S)-3-amino-2-methylpropionate transaminase
MTVLTSVPQQRLLVTEIPGPKSKAEIQRRSEEVSGGLGIAFPAVIASTGGAILVDLDGNQIIDMAAGIGVNNIGNSAQRVVDRVIEQVQAFSHTCFTVVPYQGYIDVCAKLNALTPGTHKKKSVLVNSGAEAVENAVKIARHATKRQAIVVFEHAYHGRTNLTMALTAKNMPYKDGFGPFAGEIYRMPMPYEFRWLGDKATITQDALAEIEHKIEKEIGAKNVAAIMIEPIQGEGGFIVPPTGFLPGLSKYCTENGIIFIADEVQTGFARTGNMFAVEHENVVPDMIITAKGIAGGLPLAAVTGRAEIMDAIHVSGLGGTYGGNPVACAASLGVFETIEEDGLIERAREVGKILGHALCELASKYPVIGEIRGRGAMMAIELVKPGSLEPNSEAMTKVINYCAKKGVLLLSAGTYSNVIRFLPPIVISDELLLDAMSVLDEAFASL